MNQNLIGSYWLLATLPIWVTALVLFTMTIGVVFVLRDKCEGVFYNTSYSMILGNGILIAIILMVAEMLHSGGASPPGWVSRWFHLGAIVMGVVLGVNWWAFGCRSTSSIIQWGDVYYRLVVVPGLCYLIITILPVVFKDGTTSEIISAIGFMALWVALFVLDLVDERLDQKTYLKERGILPLSG